jgi:ArsR family metal-binding transcriptional regulator
VPSFRGAPRPQLIEILKLLPKTNCRQCGEPTCMVFAARLAEGAKGVEAFPPLDSDQRSGIENYLRRFTSSRSDLID